MSRSCEVSRPAWSAFDPLLGCILLLLLLSLLWNSCVDLLAWDAVPDVLRKVRFDFLKDIFILAFLIVDRTLNSFLLGRVCSFHSSSHDSLDHSWRSVVLYLLLLLCCNKVFDLVPAMLAQGLKPIHEMLRLIIPEELGFMENCVHLISKHDEIIYFIFRNLVHFFFIDLLQNFF